MTTIAYHKASGQFAGDRLYNIGDTPITVTKVFKAKYNDAMYAAAGAMDNALSFYEWMEAGRPDDKKPKLDKELGFTGLIIEDGEIYRCEHNLSLSKLDVPFWAIGSGSDYALGAMAMGANAVEAVEIAAKYNIHTGLGVDVLLYTPSEEEKKD